MIVRLEGCPGAEEGAGEAKIIADSERRSVSLVPGEVVGARVRISESSTVGRISDDGVVS